MHQKIAAYIEKERLFTKDDKLLVAVSGGVDSIVLLHLLVRLGYDCSVAHCNFHLRGDESDRDFKFVKQFTFTYNLPFFSIDFDTKRYALEHHLSIEMAARQLRYEWFQTLINGNSFACVVVAHHADDAVETFFINLIRGTGIHGLSGMKAKQNNIVRPLLLCKRSEIEDYACKNKLCFVYDSTNSDTAFLRNYIRHKIVPQLESVNPSFTNTMLHTMSYLHDIEEVYNHYCYVSEQEIVKEENGIFQISIEKLMCRPAPQTLLYELLARFNFNSEVTEQIVDAVKSNSGKQFLSKTHRLVKDRELLLIEPIEKENTEDFIITEEMEECFSPFHLKFNYLSYNQFNTIKAGYNEAFLDKDKLTFPLILRLWKSGDRFTPFGMKQQKKISDFLIDNKLSLFEKEQTWVLTSLDQIVWVVGYRIDERYKITAATKRFLHIKLIK